MTVDIAPGDGPEWQKIGDAEATEEYLKKWKLLGRAPFASPATCVMSNGKAVCIAKATTKTVENPLLRKEGETKEDHNKRSREAFNEYFKNTSSSDLQTRLNAYFKMADYHRDTANQLLASGDYQGAAAFDNQANKYLRKAYWSEPGVAPGKTQAFTRMSVNEQNQFASDIILAGTLSTIAAAGTISYRPLYRLPNVQPALRRIPDRTMSPDAVKAGDPISVANGEYLETWRDLLIPGALSFNGARYMGIKLPDAPRWKGPLGPCQISTFDEYFSNQRHSELIFHQADGKAIQFERPFNFLPSENAAHPHLELKAPWLGRLVLKDRNIKKVFFQYDDKFYRLGWIEDLNGNRITLYRDVAGVLARAERSDGLKLIFDNDMSGRRTGITLIGVEGTKQILARYAYDARGRMISADCTFGMSVRYEWHPKKPLLLRWHNLTKRSETAFTYDDEGRVIHTATSGIWNDDRFVYDSAKRETRYLPAGEEVRAQTFAYDEHENITAEIDALGGTMAHSYNKAG